MGKQHKEIISKCQKEQYQTKNVGIRMTIPRSCAVLSHSVVCDPLGCSSPGSSVYGISQARRLEWVAVSFSRGSSPPRDQTCVSCIGRRILYR